MARTRKTVLTVKDRQAIYEETVDQSMNWLLMDNEELSKVLTRLNGFESGGSEKTKEQMLRYLFLVTMKRMIS